ncbi:hypothetical protein COV13_02540 [Candidatus Woesearchaeota archaeon CG10_big_fil_rev_8_21_14_0_10_32_9]|nr:MAG: hypothetical protein COV13_02540 [Candidatus Woesearchaeota archaeon CG10_big_fil_rev_8_21_14_0_10_32_9]
MMESLDDAKEELKRVDHLIYVSLKYTRTIDVFLNAINRMIDAYDAMFTALLKQAVENKKLEEVPKSPIERGNQLKELYAEDQQVIDNVELFFLLRKLHRASGQTREQEYRRHVTMRTIIDGKEEIVNIDIMTSYYHFQMEFFKKVKKIILGEE